MYLLKDDLVLCSCAMWIVELEKLPQGENGRGSLWILFILLFLWKVLEKENCNFFPFPMQFPLLLHP